MISIKPRKIVGSDLFNKGRICDYCGANQDTTDTKSLRFLHADCWKQYRLDGKTYKIPAHYAGKERIDPKNVL